MSRVWAAAHAGRDVATTKILLKWRWHAYARAVGQAAARHAKTLALIVGVFVFGLPLKAQLDLLSSPLAMVLAPGRPMFAGVCMLTALSVVAVALVTVQAAVVFGGPARRWSVSLPGGTAAHRLADVAVTATAIWPLWLMLVAALVRHAIGGDGLQGRSFFPALAVLALLWIGSPLVVVARSRAAWMSLVAGHLLIWPVARFGGACGLFALPAAACAVGTLSLARMSELVERAEGGIAVLCRGTPLALAWAVLRNRFGHSLCVGALMLVAMGGLSAWLVYTPDYASRSWGIANCVVPFAVYQIAVVHAWMRDEVGLQAGWLGSLPHALARFARCAAASVVALSIIFALALVLAFAFATRDYGRYAVALAWYAALALVLAACRWWGPRRSRLVDSIVTVGVAIACFSN